MRHVKVPPRRLRSVLCLGVLVGLVSSGALAQDRLKTMPGYERFEAMSREIPRSVKRGIVSVTWKDDGKSFEYRWDGKRFAYDLEVHRATELTEPSGERPEADSRDRPRERRRRPARGRQYTSAPSPDEEWEATYRDRNVWLGKHGSEESTAVTTDGSESTRVKYGTANWVYGEELFQNTAMWWSPDSRKLAFYRFDESRLQDYFLTLDHTKIQTRLDVEPYMKAGTPNPLVDILIYDLESRKTTKVDVRDGRPFDDSVVGHYVYGVSWTADGRELLLHRTNRRQNVMELCAADPESGRCRVIVREEWLPSWTENSPPLRWLEDGRRFLWISERTGWRNLYLYDLSGSLLSTLTAHAFEVADVVRVHEESETVYYTARSGDNPMKVQLHRVSMDGTGDRRLTDPAFHHSVDVAPDGRHFIDVAETHDKPPVTRLVSVEGGVLATLAESDTTRFHELGLNPVEMLTFKAADGATDLHGMLHFPSEFDPSRKYPLLVSVYAGPGTVGAREAFTLPNALTEFGFLVATFDSRSASGRGKRFLDAIYQKLGVVEVDDQAAGVRSLWKRRYVDRRRVGMFGASYGGTVSATCLLRYPDVFQAACASSAVTDYRNYDTIYAERYMWIPQENEAGYEAARIMSYVESLRGRLMLFYGTADNNVHPSNTLQLVAALQKAGKSFELQVGPDQGHAGIHRDRMMEFFIENLVLRRPPKRVKAPPAAPERPRTRRV